MDFVLYFVINAVTDCEDESLNICDCR